MISISSLHFSVLFGMQLTSVCRTAVSSMQPSGNYNNLVVTKAVYTLPINTNFMQATCRNQSPGDCLVGLLVGQGTPIFP